MEEHYQMCSFLLSPFNSPRKKQKSNITHSNLLLARDPQLGGGQNKIKFLGVKINFEGSFHKKYVKFRRKFQNFVTFFKFWRCSEPTKAMGGSAPTLN
jgi:hypothetical protein